MGGELATVFLFGQSGSPEKGVSRPSRGGGTPSTKNGACVCARVVGVAHRQNKEVCCPGRGSLEGCGHGKKKKPSALGGPGVEHGVSIQPKNMRNASPPCHFLATFWPILLNKSYQRLGVRLPFWPSTSCHMPTPLVLDATLPAPQLRPHKNKISCPKDGTDMLFFLVDPLDLECDTLGRGGHCTCRVNNESESSQGTPWGFLQKASENICVQVP